MLYYYNAEGRFEKETSREYKTEKGALERMYVKGKGAVFDETGKLLFSRADQEEAPKCAPDTNADGSVLVHNEENGQVGTIDTETVARVTGEPINEPEETGQVEIGPEEVGQPKEGLEEKEQFVKELGGAGPAAEGSFDVCTTCDSLRIRAGAGKDYRIVGYIREKAGNKENHAIMKEKDGWGKLASGEGWIELAFTKKVS